MGYLDSFVPYGTLASVNSETAPAPAGCIRDENDGNLYRCVQNKKATALAAGDVVISYTSNNYQVDTTDSADKKDIKGVVLGVITADYWGWIQCKGYNSTVKVTGSITAGNGLSTSTTAGCAGASTTAGANTKLVAAADSSTETTSGAYIYCV